MENANDLWQEQMAVRKYCGVFALAYALLMSTLVFCSVVLKLDIPGGANAGMAVASAYLAASSFVKDHGRAPSRRERRRLAWGSLFSALIVSSIGLYVAVALSGENPASFFAELVDKLTPILFGVVSVIAILVFYVVLGLTYWLVGGVVAKPQSKIRKKSCPS